MWEGHFINRIRHLYKEENSLCGICISRCGRGILLTGSYVNTRTRIDITRCGRGGSLTVTEVYIRMRIACVRYALVGVGGVFY